MKRAPFSPNGKRTTSGLKVMSVVNLRPRKLGSFEEYTIALSRRLVDLGGESVLVFREDPPENLRQPYADAGAIVDRKPFNTFAWESGRALAALMRRYEPDVVHLHFVNMLSIDVLAASFSNAAKTVYSEHSSNRIETRGSLKELVLRAAKTFFSQGVDRLVAPSEFVRLRLVDEGLRADKVQTIHNGVNLDRFGVPVSSRDVRRKYGLSPDSMLVASSALLIPEKGIGYLIEAAAEVVKAFPDVEFVHIGDGPLFQQYKERVAALGLQQVFKFVGLLNLPEIAPLLSSADVFTLPCTWGEAFSLVVLEAMAAGKPVIATRLGGNVEAVQHGKTGLLVPPADPAALATAICALRSDPARRRRMAEEAACRSAEFSLDRWVEQTLALYGDLTGVDSAPNSQQRWAAARIEI